MKTGAVNVPGLVMSTLSASEALHLALSFSFSKPCFRPRQNAPGQKAPDEKLPYCIIGLPIIRKGIVGEKAVVMRD